MHALTALAALPFDAGSGLGVLPHLDLRLPGWTQLAAVVIGALAGAVYAARRGFDAVGVLVMAVTQGLGGLLVRDILLQAGRSDVLTDSRYLIGACGAAVVGFFFAGLVVRLSGVLLVLDALAMGFLCSVGAGAALILSLNDAAAIFLGVVTAASGPILRDILSGESPSILRPGVLWAVAALMGAVTFVVLVATGSTSYAWAQIVTVVVVFAVRILALWRGWSTTPARDLSDRVWGLWSRHADEAAAEEPR